MHRVFTAAAGLAAAVLCAGSWACDLGQVAPTPRLIPIEGGEVKFGPSGGKASCKKGDHDYDHCENGKTVEQVSYLPNAVGSVSSFLMEEHEVTNAQYQRCVDDEQCTKPQDGGDGRYGDLDFALFPVVLVTHQQAQQYCSWLGRRLPNEAEWERAARLGLAKDAPSAAHTVDNKKHPWMTLPWAGEAWASDFCVKYPRADHRGCGRTEPHPEDHKNSDTTPLGLRHMASNVSEWVADSWNTFALCDDTKDGYGSDCHNSAKCQQCDLDKELCARSCSGAICKAGSYTPPQTDSSAGYHVVRGGSYDNDRCWHRLFVRRKARAAELVIGFRCVESN